MRFIYFNIIIPFLIVHSALFFSSIYFMSIDVCVCVHFSFEEKAKCEGNLFFFEMVAFEEEKKYNTIFK